jgi:hypothetical protein
MFAFPKKHYPKPPKIEKLEKNPYFIFKYVPNGRHIFQVWKHRQIWSKKLDRPAFLQILYVPHQNGEKRGDPVFWCR